MDLREDAPAEEAEVMRLRATLTCEPPNDKLHTFRGRIIIAADGGIGACHGESVSLIAMYLHFTTPNVSQTICGNIGPIDA